MCCPDFISEDSAIRQIDDSKRNIFDILPKDLVLCVFNEWLCSLKDFVSLDRALTNRGLRESFFALISISSSSPGSIHFYSHVCTPVVRHVENMSKWEKKRDVQVKNIKVVNRSIDDFVKAGCLANVSTLHLRSDAVPFDCGLFNMFHTLHFLERLHLGKCQLVVQQKDIDATIVIIPTKITQLSLSGVTFVLLEDIAAMSRRRAFSESECGKVFMKIAQYCPGLQDLKIFSCYGGTSDNVIPMIHSLSYLTKVEFACVRCFFADNNDGIKTQRSPHQSKLSSIKLTLPFYSSKIQELEVMVGCCDGQYLRHVDLKMSSLPNDYQLMLLSHIEQHWRNLQTLSLEDSKIGVYLPVCLRVCQQLQELKLRGIKFNEVDGNILAPLLVANTLPQLRSLSLDGCILTNETMLTLRQSSIAQQLTSLEVVTLDWMFIPVYAETFRLLLSSCNNLQQLKIFFCIDDYNLDDPSEHFFDVTKLLNDLFSEKCPFANSIEILDLNVSHLGTEGSDLSHADLQEVTEELYTEHMVPDWTFPFPQLRSFALDWRVNHDKMAGLIKQRLLSGHHPYLHTIKLTILKDEGNEDNVNVENRPEVIRLLREKVNQEAEMIEE